MSAVERFGWVLGLVVAMSILGCGPGAPPESAGGKGLDAVRDHQLQSLAGDEIRLADFAGEVVLIDFWATWCTPCHLQADILRDLHKEFDVPGVRFLAISTGETRETVEKFVRKNPFPYPVLLDEPETVTSALEVYALPTVIIIDKQGGISYFRQGISNGEVLHRALLEAGAKSAPDPQA